MDTPASPATRGASNNLHIGDDAQVEQVIVGSNNTQIKGFTAQQVQLLLADLRTSYQPIPFDGRSPYVGLASFQAQDADRFFGREQLTGDLVARLASSRFVIIAGPSGSGKSSLARAGVLPALKHDALPGSENWLYEILTPGRHPLAELGRSVAALTGRLSAGDEIEHSGRTDPTLLARWAEVALGDQRTRRAILLVDQFEETFTQVTDESERAAFLNLLTFAATAENGRVTILACTRSDFIGNWAAYPNLNAQLAQGVNQIPPMQDDELVSAIARPALQVGIQIDPALVKQILDDMRDAPGALPLMQFALDDLFQYKKNNGGVIALTRDDYLERGGLQKALARHADAEFANLTPQEQQLARTVFAGLIEPGRGTVDTRRTALLQELVPANSDPAQTQAVITKLADARLITTDEVNHRETITLAHERLIDAWGWLRRLVDENREAIALQNAIADDAQEWDHHHRDASYLYSGARLATAQEQSQDRNITLNPLAADFVHTAIRRRRLLRLAVGVGALLVTTFVATISTLAISGNLNSLVYRPPIMTWLPVPAGEFIMGSSDAALKTAFGQCQGCGMNEKPEHAVYLEGYEINTYEVTNKEYRQCMRAGICGRSESAQVAEEEYDKFPITDVNWFNAQKYCTWAGGRLPTEAEWEKAARGGSNQGEASPAYPWGNQWLPKAANADRGEEGNAEPVGSFDAKSPYGVSDTSGNVWEWVSDWYADSYYGISLPRNPTGPEKGTERVLRGGSFVNDAASARSMFRTSFPPGFLFRDVGFRCVRA